MLQEEPKCRNSYMLLSANSGVACNIFVGLVLGRIPSHYLLSAGLVAAALANLLFASRKQGATYWTYEFFGNLFSYGAYGLSKRETRPTLNRMLTENDCIAASTGVVYIAKVVKKEEVAAANGCLQFLIALGNVVGPALSTVVYTSVAGSDGKRRGDIALSEDGKSALLRGLRAANWFWAGLAFFGMFNLVVGIGDTDI